MEICPESSFPLAELVKFSIRHLICLVFASLEVIPRVYIALHLPDITRQLTNDNDNCKFSTCSYCVLQGFAVEIEVMVTSHPEVVRKLYVRCICFSKFLKRLL